jgi:hypothetical protein
MEPILWNRRPRNVLGYARPPAFPRLDGLFVILLAVFKYLPGADVRFVVPLILLLQFLQRATDVQSVSERASYAREREREKRRTR